LADTGLRATGAPDVVPDEAVPLSDSYRRYAMWMLLLVYILNFVDRQVINILAEPIKRDLGLSDTALGMMSGLAFAVFYTVLGLPIARLADRSNRPVIIAIALAVWSGFTVLCGLAQNFVHLVLARIGVGIGEAGCTPPAHSLISDMHPKEKRASALAFYSMGTPIGAVLGMAVGGLVADAYGWRMAFIVCGVPGVLMALIVGFTMIEPRSRKLASGLKAAVAPTVKFGTVLGILVRKKTFWLVSGAAAVKAFIGYGHAPFTASFFFRNHTQEIAEMAAFFGLQSTGFLGLCLGLVSGVGAVLGVYIGGQIADHYGKTDYRAWMSIPGIASVVVIPLFVAGMLAPSAFVAIAIFGVTAALSSLWYGPVYATAQSIAPAHMRATAAAIILFIINLVGLGLGPALVGLLSDVLNVHAGFGPAEGIRWALIISGMVGLLAGLFFWMARSSIREDMAD
jgi:MFS family permease